MNSLWFHLIAIPTYKIPYSPFISHLLSRFYTRTRRQRATTRRPVNSFRAAIHSQSTDDCDASVVVDVASVLLCTRPTLPAVFLCSIRRYVKRIYAPASCLSNWLLCWPVASQSVGSGFFQFLIFLSDSLTQFTASSTMTPPPTTLKVVENIVAFISIGIYLNK
jgi:hypothetical protein